MNSAGKNVTICGDKIPEAPKNVVLLTHQHVGKVESLIVDRMVVNVHFMFISVGMGRPSGYMHARNNLLREMPS